jgi:hypothetical protein
LGCGSSMDALRIEGSHLQKVWDRRRQLLNILKNEPLDAKDRQLIKDLLNDMQNAIHDFQNK